MFCLSFFVTFQKQEIDKKSKTSKPAKSNIPVQPLDPNFIDCSGCYKSSCHIEYTLHKRLSYTIDIACWGRVCKIYTNNEVICCRSFEVENLLVVCFTIWHASSRNEFTEDDIVELLNFTVTVKFNEDKNSLMTVSKSDNPKFFYDFKKKFESKDSYNEMHIKFCKAYETTAGVVPDFVKAKEITLAMIEESINNNTSGKYFSNLSCIPPLFHKKILIRLMHELNHKMVSYVQHQTEENLAAGVENNAELKKDKKQKENVKGKAKKIVNPDQNVIKFSGDQLILDSIYNYHEKFGLSPSLPYAAVVYTTKDVMKYYMKDSLIPFSVIIKKIYNLPPPEVRITKLFLKYSFRGILENPIETENIDLNICSKINVNHAKMFLLSHIKLADLVQGIQTGVFFIKVYGICKKDKNQVSKVYGQGELDNHIGLSHSDRYNRRILQRKDNSIITNPTTATGDDTVVRLLAHASADLSQLMNGTEWLRVHCNLTSRSLKVYDPVHSNFKSEKEEESSPLTQYNCKFLHQNAVNINEDKLADTEEAFFKESELIKHGSYIKVMAKIDIALSPAVLSDCLQSADCFSRLVIIVHDKNIASSLLTTLILINENIGGIIDAKVSTVLMPSLVSSVNGTCFVLGFPHFCATDGDSSTPDSNVSHQDSNSTRSLSLHSNIYVQHFITGFVIDCIEMTLIMVEGLTNSTFPRILTHVFRLDPAKAKVLYDSNLVFNERFYDCFLLDKKISVITMAQPLSSILRSSLVYLEGNVPIPSWQAILKLDLLSRSQTLAEVFKNNLLPTPDEMASFDLEFGLPVQIFDPSQCAKSRCIYRAKFKQNYSIEGENKSK